ncbi:ephrin-A1-like [Onthophagus taurus]|uniref:ephrin-A1-like n=1 Tax=Onthophagus taurus TaxID=166361 RepID=UPI000C204FBA|nr:ephrin-A1-like [Onthophagus taurus]XP_022909457.1 ephrin-A1-like [Onthophagus taurus]
MMIMKTSTMNWQTCNRMSRMALTTLLILLLLDGIVDATQPSNAKFYTIHWNSSNPIFRIDNTDNVIDVNRDNSKFEFDQVNLICPVYTPHTKNEDDMEKYIIYNVSKDEYETCRITNPNPRIIAVCDKPYKLMYFTITFRPFTPQPGGLEFLPGHDYYFISTSTSDDLHRRIGGRCSTHNMKMVFKVWAPAAYDTTIKQQQQPSVTITRPVWSSIPPMLRTPSTISTTVSTTTTSTSSTSTMSTTKKFKTYDKHPNDVLKSEELTLSAHSCHASTVVFIAMLAIIFALR